MSTDKAHKNTAASVEALTRRWVDTMVVGLNLCPFAAPVVRQETLRYAVVESEDTRLACKAFVDELLVINQANERDIATTLVIFPNAVADFYEYLGLLDECQRLLNQANLEGVFQLASFHPGYLFAGPPEDDLSHWTNRSPYPMIHIIREGQMEQVLKHIDDPEAIPERNIAHLEALGRDKLIELFPPFKDYC